MSRNILQNDECSVIVSDRVHSHYVVCLKCDDMPVPIFHCYDWPDQRVLGYSICLCTLHLKIRIVDQEKCLLLLAKNKFLCRRTSAKTSRNI